MSKRKWVKDRERKQWQLRTLLRRSGGKCEYCGKQCNRIDKHPDSATIDHVVPTTGGGSDNMSNLKLACHACNQSKGDSYVDEWKEERGFGGYWD